VLDVVEKPENLLTQISYKDALEKDPNLKPGDQYYEILPPIDLGRVPAQAAKHVIVHRVNEIEREKQYQDFKDRKGEIVSGVVKRVDFGNATVDLSGRAEAVIKKDQQIKTEVLKINDRIKAYVQDVRPEPKGSQIFLSRTDDGMLFKLFELEVPEIYDGVISIKSIARDPGSKAKIAVFAADTSIDPIGSCVGIRGSRVKAVTNELAGEKIDIVLWDSNVAKFVMNAMSPVEISKIVIDEDRRRVEVVVPKEQLSIAIGRRGQNVRLASKLTGWAIDVMTEEQESKRRTDEFNTITDLYTKALEVEEVIAQLLSAEGFNTVEQIACAEVSTLSTIEGFDESLAQEIKNRAINYVELKNQDIVESLEKLGVEQELLDILYLSPEHILVLAEYGIKTTEDLVEMSVEEFKNLIPSSDLSDVDIMSLIESARNKSK
jgi:N utilization substance protein A